MKSILAILFIFCCKVSFSQSFSAPSLNVDMHNLFIAYLSDFKTIWGKRKLATDKEIVYHSNYRVTGSVAQSNFVIYNKLDKTFAFSCVMDSQFVKAAGLKDAFRKVQLPVGKLKEVDQDTNLITYVLANKSIAPYKAKKLTIKLSKAADNISRENAMQFSFKIVAVEDELTRL